jgi:hypothetical protein
MNSTLRRSRALLSPWVALLLGALASTAWAAGDLVLTGANEVPAVTTTASGSGRITVAGDGAVSGSVKTTGIAATMAHIHVGAAGKNGPVIVPLSKGADGSWTVPAGAKLTAEQMKSYQAGELYVNVHSDAHKGGEIRAQLTP